ncbi:hypothetical protein BO71DRAFT_423538 [Aspergillus ellipticus CBS 707.79]|uniref:BZIP domain-containing protein n=1 Tax=Aspergillus ellipticus CBS 707.79 TaxID=1448320 RepID=A0A319CV69_9EURO|nr:hypothetical protein BO71DRAFT_423538 [Aspergillus ellipticus CBS 707.79]
MDLDKNQKDLNRRARIRDNQRRSRAQKQSHTRELEQKLATLQEQARFKDVEHRLAIQKLEAENRKLSFLLSRSGLSLDVIEEYLQAVDDPNITQKLAIPNLRQPEGPCQSPCRQKQETRACLSRRDDAIGGTLNPQRPGEPETAPKSFPKASHQDELQSGGPVQEQSVCGCPPNETLASWPKNEDVLNTTLCAIADELISQYNTRGVDMAEIRRKLWAGFSKGLTTDEGCRVQNQILFQVLDEISNN